MSKINNILRPCKCDCKTPIIEKGSPPFEESYRVVCPKCGNGENMYFIDSLQGCIKAWNVYFWKGE